MRISNPSSESQIFNVLSAEPETIRLPSGEKHTELTAYLCPFKLWISEPLSESQIFNVLSLEQEAIFLESGEKHTELIQPLCPLN